MKDGKIGKIADRIRDEAERLGNDPAYKDLAALGLIENDPIEAAARRVKQQLDSERSARNVEILLRVSMVVTTIIALATAYAIGRTTGNWAAAVWAVFCFACGYAVAHVKDAL